jgi:two-component system chemotaxis response regulator CheY
VPKIKRSINEWWIIEVFLTGQTSHNVGFIAKKLKEYFDYKDGVIFICNSKNILVLAHMGPGQSSQTLTNDIRSRMPKMSCNANAVEATADGLLKVQIQLKDLENEAAGQTGISPLLRVRNARQENVIMVADDDMFMRSLVTKNFVTKGRIIEFETADNIVDAYLENLPDIVFLDIHLPGGSGIDILSEILSFDETAYVVIVSADSIKDNILNSKNLGAKGFIVKPFTREKLDAFYSKCATIKAQQA